MKLLSPVNSLESAQMQIDEGADEIYVGLMSEYYKNYSFSGRGQFGKFNPDENSFDVMQEGQFLKKKSESSNEIEIVAVVGNVVVGTAGIEAIGTKYKVRHRAEFGISVAKDFWGLGIGQALMAACIECARAAGYIQLELNVVAENERALSMYEKAGFVKYGRNPKGFNSRVTGFQEVIYMRLEL